MVVRIYEKNTNHAMKNSTFYLLAVILWIPFAIYRLTKLWNDTAGIIVVTAPALLFFVMWIGVRRKEKTEIGNDN